MNKELLIERIAALCKEKGVNMHTAFVESGAGKNFKSNLKTSDPSDKNLALLAKYFNVTVAYLLGEETTEDLTRRAMGLVIEWLIDNATMWSRTKTIHIQSEKTESIYTYRLAILP